jgi:hypothetical protein
VMNLLRVDEYKYKKRIHVRSGDKGNWSEIDIAQTQENRLVVHLVLRDEFVQGVHS